MSFISNTGSSQAKIIGVADATHYLVGEADGENNFSSLKGAHSIAVVYSLREAKQFLREHNVTNATLELQSAYDEMCGSQFSGVCSQNIKL